MGKLITFCGRSSMDRSADPQLHTLVEFLADCKLSHLQESLADETLANLAAEHDAGRQPMLKHLKQKGVDRLIERQNLTNALGRAKKAGRVQPSANDVPPGKPPVGKVVAGTGLDDCGLSKVQPASTAKRINCGVVCCVGDTARNEFEFSLSQRSCTPNVPLPFRRDEVVRLISVESGAAGAQRVLRGENVMVFICTTIRDALCLATKQEQAGVVLITSKSCDEAVQLISTFGSSPPHVSVSTVPPNEPAELRSALHVNMLQAGVMWQEGASPWQDERGMGWLEPPITSTLQSLSSLLRQPTMVPRVLVVEPCTRSASQMKCVLQEIGFLADAVPTAADARRQLAFSLGAAAFYAIVLVETALPGDEDGESGYALASWYHHAARSDSGSMRPAASFISLTAEPDVDASESFGFLACVPKPLTAHCALCLFRQWMDHQFATEAERANAGCNTEQHVPVRSDLTNELTSVAHAHHDQDSTGAI